MLAFFRTTWDTLRREKNHKINKYLMKEWCQNKEKVNLMRNLRKKVNVYLKCSTYSVNENGHSYRYIE